MLHRPRSVLPPSGGRSRASKGLAVLLASSALSLALLAPVGGADSAAIAATLPTSRFLASAVWDPAVSPSCPQGCAYLFGGFDGVERSEILRYDPAGGAVTTTGATLPWPMAGTNAVWDGQGNAYVFGGYGPSGGYLRHVVRYTPASNAVTVMAGTLPSGRSNVGAVWDPTATASCPAGCAYLFGGSGTGQILRYDPAADAVAVMAATLPSPRDGTAAIWDGQGNAYVMGGQLPGCCVRPPDIVRYTPATDTATLLAATLPQGTRSGGAFWDGKNAYVLGGDGGLPAIRFTPSTGTVTVMSLGALPGTTGWGSGLAYDGKSAYVFGGYGSGCANCYSDKVLRYSLEPGSPSLSVQGGPLPGQATLSWQPPGSNTYSENVFPVTSYVVYRAAAGGAFSAIATTAGAVTTYTDTTFAPTEMEVSYTYRVAAVNAVGQGPSSAPACAKPLPFSPGLVGCSLLPGGIPP